MVHSRLLHLLIYLGKLMIWFKRDWLKRGNKKSCTTLEEAAPSLSFAHESSPLASTGFIITPLPNDSEVFLRIGSDQSMKYMKLKKPCEGGTRD